MSKGERTLSNGEIEIEAPEVKETPSAAVPATGPSGGQFVDDSGDLLMPEVDEVPEAEDTTGGDPETDEGAPSADSIVDDEQMQAIIKRLQEQGHLQQRRQPPLAYEPSPVFAPEFWKERFGEALDENQVKALHEMAMEISRENMNWYHQNHVVPQLSRLNQNAELQQEENALQSLQVRYKDVDKHMERMGQILNTDPEIAQMSPTKRVKVAYLMASEETKQDALRAAEKQGRMNERRDMARTPMTLAGKPQTRRTQSQSLSPDAIAMIRSMGADPDKVARVKSDFRLKGGLR